MSYNMVGAMEKVDKKICRKVQGKAEPGNTCLTTPGTCESCPEWERPVVRFTVYGHPEPKGSTRAFLPKGWKHPVITTANKKAKPWHQQVAGAAFDIIGALPFPRPNGVSASFRFVLARPVSLSKKLIEHTKKPDVDKLARLVSDALTGIVWDDDSQIVALHATKEYGAPERVEICVAQYNGVVL